MGRNVRSRTTEVDNRISKLQAIISLGWLEIDPELAPGLLGDLSGGYYRDVHGKPVKDGVHDHRPDGFGYAIDCVFEFDEKGPGLPVYRPSGLDDVRGGLSGDGGVWRPEPAAQRRLR
jgi:hypothetical protein